MNISVNAEKALTKTPTLSHDTEIFSELEVKEDFLKQQ